jgi:hypothetical protein
MNCYECNEELIWGGDHTYEDYGVEGEGIIANLSCQNDSCGVEQVLVYIADKDKPKVRYFDDMLEGSIVVTEIEKVKFVGKWIEFWFRGCEYLIGGGIPKDESTINYHGSCKQDHFWEKLEKANDKNHDAIDDVWTNGMKGIKVSWKKKGINWEIHKIG